MKQGRRRRRGRLAAALAVMLAGMFVVWLVVLGLGIAIPLDGFRDTIETALARKLGRVVQIDGALLLRPTIGPTIVAHDVRVGDPTGQGELLRAGRIVVQLAPAALLRGDALSRRLLIDDAGIDLASAATDPAQAAAEHAAGYPWPLPAAAELLLHQPELQELVLYRSELNYRDAASGQARQIKLDELSLYTAPGRAVELLLRGRFRQQPFSLDLTGGQLAQLLTPTAPWPLRARVNVADTRLLLDGQLQAHRQEALMTFDLVVDWPAELARFAVWFPQTPLSGQLALRTDQQRLFAGELRLPALDAVLRFGEGAGRAGDSSDRPGRGGKARTRPVAVPLILSIADVPFHGRLLLAGQAAHSTLELAARNADVGRLMASLTGIQGVRGRLRRIALQTSVRGGGETDILSSLALSLQAHGTGLSYGNSRGERPVDVTLDELALTLSAGESVLMSARGKLRDEPFSVDLRAGELAALKAEDGWPVSLSATGGGAELDISGTLAGFQADRESRLGVSLFGKRIGDLAPWLGVSPCETGAYTLRGQLVLAEDIGRLQFLQVHTDRTRLNAELDWSGYDQTDFLHAVLHFEEWQPADMAMIMPLFKRDADEGIVGGVAIDMPVLPAPIEVRNADIELATAHIPLKMVDISDVALSMRIRQGRLQRSPFHAQLGNASFQGYLDPADTEAVLVIENVDIDSAAGERMDKLFSSAVRLVGNSAVVPLHWLISKQLSDEDSVDCELKHVEAAD